MSRSYLQINDIAWRWSGVSVETIGKQFHGCKICIQKRICIQKIDAPIVHGTLPILRNTEAWPLSGMGVFLAE
jgi:hypothetical protein